MTSWLSHRRGWTFATILIGVAAALAAAKPCRGSDHAVTASRLNLRRCPATVGCPVVRTLPVGARLEVVSTEDDWLKVRVEYSGDQGWVHSQYVTRETPPSAPALPPTRLSLVSVRVALSLVGAILLLSLLARTLSGGHQLPHPTRLIILSVAVGTVFLLNQLGALIARWLAGWIDLSSLSPLWEANAVTSSVSPSAILLILVACTLGIVASAPADNGGRLSFVQGLLAGCLLVPTTTLAAALAVLAVWLLGKIFSFLLIVIGWVLFPFKWLIEHLLLPLLRWLAIPLVWLWNHVLAPLFHFLAIPLVWLWDHVLEPVLRLLAIPFVWLWNVVLKPLLALLAKYVVRPLAVLALSVAAATLCLLPLATVGLALIEAARAAFKDPFNHIGLFSQGIATGLLIFDCATLMILGGTGVLQSQLPLTLLLTLTLPIVTLIRLLVRRRKDDPSGADEPFFKKFVNYCESSKVSLLASCLVMPFFLVLQVLQAGDE